MRPLRISLQSVDKIQRQQAAAAIVLGKRAPIFHMRLMDRVDGAHPAIGEVMQVNKERDCHLPLERGVSGAMAR